MDREPAKKFQDLVVWQKSHALTLRIYRLTVTFPKYELYGLASQMRRAAVSVPANIAEGFSKRGRSDKARFMNTAQASLEEVRYYFILARDLGYAVGKAVDTADVDEVARLLGAYCRSLLASSS
jgi:four helix bundle protein